MPEYAAEKAGAGTAFGKERQKCSDIFKGSENSEKSGVFILITLSKHDAPDSEAGTLSGVQLSQPAKSHAKR